MFDGHFFEQHPAGGLHQLAGDLRFDDAGVDHRTGIDRAIQVLYAHLAGFDVHGYVSYCRTIGDQVRAQAHTATAAPVPALRCAARNTRLPFGRMRCGIEHTAPAGIGNVALPKCYRV